jgi:hypothetical protein
MARVAFTAGSLCQCGSGVWAFAAPVMPPHRDRFREDVISYYTSQHREHFLTKVTKKDDVDRTLRRNALLRVARAAFKDMPMSKQNGVVLEFLQFRNARPTVTVKRRRESQEPHSRIRLRGKQCPAPGQPRVNETLLQAGDAGGTMPVACPASTCESVGGAVSVQHSDSGPRDAVAKLPSIPQSHRVFGRSGVPGESTGTTAPNQAPHMESMILGRLQEVRELCDGDIASALDITAASIRFLRDHGALVWEFGRCRNDFSAMLVKVATVLGIGIKYAGAGNHTHIVKKIWLSLVPSAELHRVRALEMIAINVMGMAAERPSQ